MRRDLRPKSARTQSQTRKDTTEFSTFIPQISAESPPLTFQVHINQKSAT